VACYGGSNWIPGGGKEIEGGLRRRSLSAHSLSSPTRAYRTPMDCGTIGWEPAPDLPQRVVRIIGGRSQIAALQYDQLPMGSWHPEGKDGLDEGVSRSQMKELIGKP
jgi:hypothetical protein